MRLGIDARPLAAPTSGIGRYTAEILSHLIEQSDLELFLYAHRKLNIPLSNRVKIRTGNIKKNFLSSIYAQSWFPIWAKKDALDAFWSPRHHLPLALQIPTIVTIHDLIWQQQPQSMQPANRWLESVLMKPSIRKANQLIAVSEATKSDLSNWQPQTANKTTVIYEAAFATPASSISEPTDLGLVAATKQPFVLFVGTFEPRKNLTRLLAAFQSWLGRSTTSHNLVLAGRNGWGTDITQQIQQRNLGHRVQIVDGPSDAQLIHLYSSCDFLVQPSLYEGFGLPIIEALEFGKPCIYGNVSSMPEVAGDAGIGVDPTNEEELSSALERLSSDRILHAELATAARHQASKFSWKQAGEQTYALIRNLTPL